MPKHNKRAKLSKGRGTIREESSSPFSGSEEEIKDSEILTKKGGRGNKSKETSLHTKDLQLSIFHALGKFLYNKRVHPKTRKVEQLPYKLMQSPTKRPDKYFKPQEVMEQSMLEPSLFTLYLHQNMPQFYADIGDMADALEYMSHQDSVTSQLSYSYSNMQEISQMQQLSGHICALGITETNLHCLEARQDRMVTMQAPYYFEHSRTLKVNKLTLRD